MENQVTETEVQETVDTTDYKAECEKLRADLEKVAAKKEELYAETKKAKKEKEEQLAATKRAEQERAQKDGEFEKLWLTSEDQRKALEEQLQSERNAVRQEKIHIHAMELAVELADGDAPSAKLLAKFLQDSLSKVADEKGSLDESVLSAVRKEFKNNADYAPLLGGSKASGGGALGNLKSTVNMVDSKLSAVDRINSARTAK